MPQAKPANDSACLPSVRSAQLFERAKGVFPDGTTRGTVERDPIPRYVARGEGAYLIDIDGQRFLDLNNNFTTLIHGHGFTPVREAVEQVLKDGTCFSNPTWHEVLLAELLCDRIPAVEQIRFVNTGSEAVMFAIKAARAYTGRPGVAKIEGAYHGSYDWAEIGQSGSPSTWGPPDDPAPVLGYAGAPASAADDVVIIRFNDVVGAQRRIAEAADRLACVLIDPMPSRAGLIAPEPEFIEAVVSTARAHGVLVVSDEVLNLRQGYQGASARYGLQPDLMALGKIIGGGFPIGAIGGSRKAMRVFDASGGRAKVSQGGTFSANPVSMVAGRASMEALGEEQFARLEQMGDRLRHALNTAISEHQAPFSVTGAASLFRIHPKRQVPRDFRDAYPTPLEAEVMKVMSRHFLEHGVILPFGAAACLSTPMTDADLDHIAGVFTAFLETGASIQREAN